MAAERSCGSPVRASFCTAELLANAIKHSSANVIEITIDTERKGVLRLCVTDDGMGGADPSRGSGLEGLAQRASTVDGPLHGPSGSQPESRFQTASVLTQIGRTSARKSISKRLTSSDFSCWIQWPQFSRM